MSVCPQCQRNFGDREFRICPIDGADLVDEPTRLVDPMLGRVLDGRFRLTKLIGRGGMGAVYKAIQIQMDRVCAIKLVSPVSNDKEAALARFRREARMTSRIDSPNAITIYDFGEAEPGLLYLAMEFIEGVTLADVLEREFTLPPQRVVSITTQTANALAAAHSLGIVHRDLKPSNIMLIDKDGLDVVKVLDFGIAKSVNETTDDPLTQTGMLLGTPTYMSPEQVLGETVTSRTDVYSLAIIVYEMLSGRAPFEGDNVRSLMMSRLTGEPKPLREVAPLVNDAVEKVVMSGLVRDQELRMPDALTFARSLSAAFASQTRFEPASKRSDETPTILHVETETPFPAAATGSSVTVLAPKPKSKTFLFVFLILTLVVFVLGLAGVGTFLYLSSRQSDTANAPANPAVQTSQPGLVEAPTSLQPDNNRTANAHYQRGRALQQEAQRLLDAGSPKVADEKNLEATVEYRKALEQHPNFPEAHENLGVAFYNLGKAADAVTEYELAIAQTQKPGAQLLTNYGMALLALNRFREAANAFTRALEYEPKDKDLYYYKGFALHFAGDNEGSRAAFLEYLRVAPAGQHAKDVREILDGRATPTLKGGSRR